MNGMNQGHDGRKRCFRATKPRFSPGVNALDALDLLLLCS
jgi:hypothetical protein